MGPVLRNPDYGLDFRKRLLTAVVFCHGSPPREIVGLGADCLSEDAYQSSTRGCTQTTSPQGPDSIPSRGSGEDGVGSDAGGIDVRIPDGKGNS
jgi:hypothetical protein